MTSEFDQNFADVAVGALMDNQGTTVTYKDPGREDVDVTAIVSQETREEDDGQSHHRGWRRVRNVTFTRDEQSTYGGVATPLVGAVVVITEAGVTEEWNVASVVSMCENFVTLKVVNGETRSVNSPGYYGD